MRTNRLIQITVFGVSLLFFVLWQTATAGPPEKPGNPRVPGLLAEIAELEATIEQYGEFAPVPKTGQTVSYANGDDGDLQKGVEWPVPRFTDNFDGTVTDNLTGLIWLKNASCFGEQTWAEALSACNTLASPVCGLTDGSIEGDWRLPNVKELESLIHFGFYEPALPDTAGTGKWSEEDPFTGVRSEFYWSSSTYAPSATAAWHMFMYIGRANYGVKTSYISYYAWPVRDADGWGTVYNTLFDSLSDLELLRKYRDEILSKTTKGSEYKSLLYESSEEALAVLLENPELMAQAKALIYANMVALEDVLDGYEGTIYNTHEIVTFLNAYAKESPPALKVLAKMVKRQMLRKQKQGKLFFGFRLE